MELQATANNQTHVLSKKEALKQKQDAAVERVQTEYLRQISEGKEQKQAILDSLKAIDEKYHPQDDQFKHSEECVGYCADIGTTMKSAKLPTTKDIKKFMEHAEIGLDAIARIVPKIICAIEALKMLMDSILPNTKESDSKKMPVQDTIAA